jgi:hypothetical protein
MPAQQYGVQGYGMQPYQHQLQHAQTSPQDGQQRGPRGYVRQLEPSGSHAASNQYQGRPHSGGAQRRGQQGDGKARTASQQASPATAGTLRCKARSSKPWRHTPAARTPTPVRPHGKQTHCTPDTLQLHPAHAWRAQRAGCTHTLVPLCLSLPMHASPTLSRLSCSASPRPCSAGRLRAHPCSYLPALTDAFTSRLRFLTSPRPCFALRADEPESTEAASTD